MTHLFWIVTFHYWEMNVNFNSLIWTKFLNLILLLNPNLIYVNSMSQHWFLFLSFPEPKLTITLNHIPLLDQGIDSYDSAMIFENWSYNRDKFHVRILHDPIHIGDYNNVNKKEVNKVKNT